MGRPRILDLFCGEGGAARGYIAAGYEPIGIDYVDRLRKRYPGDFLCSDLANWTPRDFWTFCNFHGIQAVHASPPCQWGTKLRHAPNGKVHRNLIPHTRALLESCRRPWVIENVDSPEAREALPGFVRLDGYMFGLGAKVEETFFHLERSRLFQASFPLVAPPPTRYTEKPSGAAVIGIYGGHVRNRSAAHGGRGTVDFPGLNKPALAAHALGLEPGSMTMDGMSQCIPPAFAKFVGLQMMPHLPEPYRW